MHHDVVLVYFLVFYLLMTCIALVEEIFAAQKEHDEAILARMRLANDERDDALSRAKMLQEKDDFDSGTDVNSNEDDDNHKDIVSYY